MIHEEMPPPGMRPGVDYAENMRALRDRTEALGRILDKLETWEELEHKEGLNAIGIALVDIGYAREIQDYLEWVARVQVLPVPKERLATQPPRKAKKGKR